MILNFVLNNSVTYRDRRLQGWRFWGGLLTFCLACGLGVAANVAIANEAFHRGVPWVLAAVIGLALLPRCGTYGVTSMTTWRQERRSSEQRARQRMEAGAAANWTAGQRENRARRCETWSSVCSSAFGELPVPGSRRRILASRMIISIATGIYAGLGAAAARALRRACMLMLRCGRVRAFLAQRSLRRRGPASWHSPSTTGPMQRGRRSCSTSWRSHDVRATFFSLGDAPKRSRNWCGGLRRPATSSAITPGTIPTWRGALLNVIREELKRTQRHARADHGRAGEIFPAAVRSAPAGGVSHRARDGPEAGAVERDDVRLERSLAAADRDSG